MVKCADCGFLALVDRDRKVIEADLDTRLTGNAPVVNETTPSLSIKRRFPTCSVLAADLKKECSALEVPEKSPTDKAIFLAVFAAQRECSKFTPWIRGHSPKEHLAMVLLEKANREAAERAERATREQREWQERRDAEQKRYNEEQKERDRIQNFKINVMLAVIGSALSILVAFVLYQFGVRK